MRRRSELTTRPLALARILTRRSYRWVNALWVPTDPLPLFRQYIRFYRWVTGKEFSDADPFELIEIDPRSVAHVSNRAKGWNSLLGEVVGGDWDRRSVPITDIPLVDILADHIQRGEPIDYDRYRAYAADEPRRPASFGVRCERLTNLVWDIARNGYRTQRELIERDGVESLQGMNNDTLHPLLNEIRVDIDREGRFHHWRCGLHRLTIAQVLGIETIPVLVGTRHAEWQAVRDQFRRASSVDDLPEEVRCYVGHPDLRDLVTEAAAESNRESKLTGTFETGYTRQLLPPLVERFPSSGHVVRDGDHGVETERRESETLPLFGRPGVR